ncbi:MAG TPA: hypothetical protein VMS08_03590 [Candidatus Saccharimonadia bacterium]|nr:hypothetical protein [Candidatus Saccharimonadia bacterium]
MVEEEEEVIGDEKAIRFDERQKIIHEIENMRVEVVSVYSGYTATRDIIAKTKRRIQDNILNNEHRGVTR